MVSDSKIWEDFVFARSIRPETLNILKNMWLEENKNLKGIYLNMALGVSLSEKKIEECISKYQYYKKAYNQNKLFKQFKELEPWEFKLLFDGRESVSELEWAQEFVSQKKKFKPWNAASVACRWIPYREKNSKGISVHKGAAFYDFKPISLKIYVEYGGVCGAVSKGAAGFLRSKGVPAYTIGQPEHCAFIWKNPKGRWVIGNDIHGWRWSEGGKGIPWKGPATVIQAISQFKANPKARASTFFYELSELNGLIKYKTVLLDKALSLNFYNYEAWKEYFKTKPVYQSLDSLKLDFVKFQKVFSENNRLWCDLLYKYINTGKLNKYEVCSLLLGDKLTNLSEQVYMRKYFLLLKSDIDGFQKKCSYNPKVEKKVFDVLSSYLSTGNIDKKMQVQICEVMQQTIASLNEHPKMLECFLNLYLELLNNWDNEFQKLKAKKQLKKIYELSTSHLSREKIRNVINSIH